MDEREKERAVVTAIKERLDGVSEAMQAASELGIEVNFNIQRGKRNKFEVQNFSAKKDLALP